MTRSDKGVEHVAEKHLQHIDFGHGSGNVFGPIVDDGDFVSRVDPSRSRIILPQSANAIAICVSAGGNLLMRARRMSHASRAEACKIFDETFDELADALVRGEPVKLRNFGTFNLRAKRQRTGRNPKTGAEAVISARRVVTFHPSPALLTRINQESADCLPD
jgi:integration host factor subunit alpha